MASEKMTLSAGATLGRYEIRSLIGAGGMGEVYLAQDKSELSLICYTSGYPSGWAECGGYVVRDDGTGNPIMIEAGGYCNSQQNPEW